MNEKLAEVRRLLDRYIVEVVVEYGLCPWARLSEELAVEVLWGTPAIDGWVEAAAKLLVRPDVRVVMVVAPELDATPRRLRVIRDAVAARMPAAGVADFHPGAPLDLATPARLVPYLRRSPDPLLQLVPLALLEAVRGAPPAVDRAEQAQMLVGRTAPGRGDVADRIAAVNHERVMRDADAIAARLAAIAEDRARSYARVGIRACR